MKKDWYYNHVNASAENSLLCLNTPAVRDLAWSCFSAPLLLSSQLGEHTVVQNAGFALTEKRMSWLESLDLDPKPLANHLAKSSTRRLGLYFETLWHFFLEQDSEIDLLAHNLAVRDSKRTLGEFDCIYFCHRRQRNVHLELAVKFYLSAPAATGSEQHNWLGPNSKDRLDLKLQRMMSHQIRLAHTPEGSAALAELGVSDPLLEIEIKGRLFNQWRAPAPPPPGYNLALNMPNWRRLNELSKLDEGNNARYLPLERSQWLSPVAGCSDATLSKAELIRHGLVTLGNDPRPIQIALVDINGNEQERFFLVSDDWPSHYV
ncbi:MAG: DUF1853 family protein [Halioglobus sp.]